MQRDVEKVARLKAEGTLVRCTMSDDEIDGGLRLQSEDKLEAALHLLKGKFNAEALEFFWASARLALEAFLAYQGLAVQTVGDKHKVTIEATRGTQFGVGVSTGFWADLDIKRDTVNKLDQLRIRRNDLAYPQADTQPVSDEEIARHRETLEILHHRWDEVAQTLRCV